MIPFGSCPRNKKELTKRFPELSILSRCCKPQPKIGILAIRANLCSVEEARSYRHKRSLAFGLQHRLKLIFRRSLMARRPDPDFQPVRRPPWKFQRARRAVAGRPFPVYLSSSQRPYRLASYSTFFHLVSWLGRTLERA